MHTNQQIIHTDNLTESTIRNKEINDSTHVITYINNLIRGYHVCPMGITEFPLPLTKSQLLDNFPLPRLHIKSELLVVKAASFLLGCLIPPPVSQK